MQEIINWISSQIELLQNTGLLRFVLGAFAFLATFLILQVIYKLLSRRFDLKKIRHSLLLVQILVALLTFFITLADSSIVRIINSVLFFSVILVLLRIVDIALIEDYLIQKRGFHISRLLRDTIKGLLFVSLFLFMLNVVFDISLEGLGITAAVATGVLGFALKDTLSSIIAGFSISIEKPFKVNDWIQINNLEGRVEQISWRTTRIRTFNDDYIIVPNYTISHAEIINYFSPSRVHSRELDIGTDYRHPPEQVKAALIACIDSTENIIKHPSPVVRLIRYNDFSIDYRMKFWINDFSLYPDIENRLLSKVWYKFKREGIVIPFPISDIRMPHRNGLVEASQPLNNSELASIPLLASLPEAHRLKLGGHLQRQLYGKGEKVFSKGDRADYLYFILRGSVSVEKNMPGTRKDREIVVETGELFGEMAMFSGGKRNATIKTREECELLLLSRENFRAILEEQEETARALVQLIEERRLETPGEGIYQEEPDRANREGDRNSSGNQDTKNNQKKAGKHSSLLEIIKGYFSL